MSIFSNIDHFFMRNTFKLLSSLETCSALSLSVVHLPEVVPKASCCSLVLVQLINFPSFPTLGCELLFFYFLEQNLSKRCSRVMSIRKIIKLVTRAVRHCGCLGCGKDQAESFFLLTLNSENTNSTFLIYLFLSLISWN